jgi:hypothetical protein
MPDRYRTIRAGDLVLAHGTGIISKIIRFGQWLRPSWRPYRYWNHTAIVVAELDGVVKCVQMARRCEIVTLDEVAPGGRVQVRSIPDGVDRLRAVDWALQQARAGRRYSFLTIISIALQLITPKWLNVDFHDNHPALICSALVARAWEHGGWDCPSDPFQITPAELARITA